MVSFGPGRYGVREGVERVARPGFRRQSQKERWKRAGRRFGRIIHRWDPCCLQVQGWRQGRQLPPYVPPLLYGIERGNWPAHIIKDLAPYRGARGIYDFVDGGPAGCCRGPGQAGAQSGRPWCDVRASHQSNQPVAIHEESRRCQGGARRRSTQRTRDTPVAGALTRMDPSCSCATVASGGAPLATAGTAGGCGQAVSVWDSREGMP